MSLMVRAFWSLIRSGQQCSRLVWLTLLYAIILTGVYDVCMTTF